MLQCLLGVEVGDTLTADGASEDILMGINKGVDAGFSELVDHSCDLVEVGIIIDSLGALNGLPHDTKTHEVHAPLHKAFNILVVQRVLTVEVAGRWDIRVDFVDDIDTVEDDLTAILVSEGTVGVIDVDSLGNINVRHLEDLGSESGVGHDGGGEAECFE